MASPDLDAEEELQAIRAIVADQAVRLTDHRVDTNQQMQALWRSLICLCTVGIVHSCISLLLLAYMLLEIRPLLGP